MYYKRKSTKEIISHFIKNNTCMGLVFLDCDNCPFIGEKGFCKHAPSFEVYNKEKRRNLVIDYYLKNIGTIEDLFEELL